MHASCGSRLRRLAQLDLLLSILFDIVQNLSCSPLHEHIRQILAQRFCLSEGAHLPLEGMFDVLLAVERGDTPRQLQLTTPCTLPFAELRMHAHGDATPALEEAEARAFRIA